MRDRIESVSITAKNFAAASENKMHDDATAAQFGYRGGLVPGVGVYGYMTIPVVREFGPAWFDSGRMWGKFLKPVYDGETVRVEAEETETNPRTIETRVVNADGVLCSVGRADHGDPGAAPRIDDYPAGTLPAEDARPPGDLAHIAPGMILGEWAATLDLPHLQGESGELFADDMCDPSPLYRGPDARCHPAYYPAMANRILVRNVKLGPWIHTESTTHHFRSLHNGETLRVRGRVTHAEVKRGHEFVVLDVALFGDAPGAVATVRHTAIVRPAAIAQQA